METKIKKGTKAVCTQRPRKDVRMAARMGPSSPSSGPFGANAHTSRNDFRIAVQTKARINKISELREQYANTQNQSHLLPCSVRTHRNMCKNTIRAIAFTPGSSTCKGTRRLTMACAAHGFNTPEHGKNALQLIERTCKKTH